MKSVYFFFSLLLIGLTSVAQKPEIFQKEGYAIRGYDPVAFHTEGKAVKGLPEITHKWKSADWLFVSKENMEIFLADPEKYAPQYGGYCAYGMSEGYKAPTEIDTWTVVNHKLYFNYNQKVKDKWIQQTTEYIRKADINWMNMLVEG